MNDRNLSGRAVCSAFATFLASGAPAAMAQPGPCEASWQNRAFLARSTHAAAYDPRLSRIMVFGGNSQGSPDKDLCAWDGSGWSCIEGAWQMWPRGLCAMAYDSEHGELVMFGGEYLADDDTWTWDGVAWTRHDVPGPSARWSHAMAYDSVRREVVLYGGTALVNSQYEYYADTWAWNGNAWTLRNAAGGAWSAGFARDDVRSAGADHLFGGRTPSLAAKNDVWTWNGAAWQQVPTALSPAPEGRWGTTLAYDPAGNRLVVAGGSRGDSNPLADAWALNGLTWSRIASLPARTSYATLTCDEARSRATLIGGWAWTGDQVAASDAVYTLEGDQWRPAPPISPPAVSAQAMAFDGSAGRLVLFGGRYSASLRGETWVRETGVWRQAATSGPSPRESAAMGWHEASGKIVLFSGRDTSLQTPADTWEWDGVAWSRREVDGPPGRQIASMVYDARRGRLLVYGGYDATGSTPLNDLWEWDGERWEEIAQPGVRPPAGIGRAVYDARRDRLVVFAGWNSTETFAQMWEWNGQYWSLRERSGPVRANAFGSSAFCYSPVRGRSLLLQPETGAWEWDGEEWSFVAGPRQPTYFGASVFDTQAGVLACVAGIGPGGLPQKAMWEYASPRGPSVVEQARDVVLCPLGDASFSVEVFGEALAYQWTRGDEPMSDGTTAWGSAVHGSGTSRLEIAGVRPEDEAWYRCLVTNSCGEVYSTAALLVCRADFDCSGSVDFFDYLDFAAAFSAGDSRADFDRNGTIDFFDYLDFIVALRDGC